MTTIDAKGKNCPIPVIMAKAEIDKGLCDFNIEVDNKTAVHNLEKLAKSQGYTVCVNEFDNYFDIHFNINSNEADMITKKTANFTSSEWAVFVGKDYIGEGNQELGNSLMKMFFFTLSQSSDIPKYILFMNAGVKLPLLDEQIIEHLKVLEDKGVEILICGTCVNFYNITEPLKIGNISNMYDILQKMQIVQKVITL